jgi:hypothetical protein
MVKKLEEQDREDAMKALARRIHYDIAPFVLPRAAGREVRPETLFETGAELDEFCRDASIQKAALLWVIDGLKRSSLAEFYGGRDGAVILTAHGVIEYCGI